MYGVRLLMLHPEVSSRSCSDCQTYLYNDRGPGLMGDVNERGGVKTPRPRNPKTGEFFKGGAPPCHWCPKVPLGDPPRPESAQELTEENFQALMHYRECRAVGDFPGDAIVRRNAALIRMVEDSVDQIRQVQSANSVMKSLQRGI